MSKKCIGLICLIIAFAVITALSITTTLTPAMAEGGTQQDSTSQLKSIKDISKEVPDLIKSDVAPFGYETQDATTRENHILLMQSELYGTNHNKVYRYDPVYDVSNSKNTSTDPSISLGEQVMTAYDFRVGVAFDPVGNGIKNYIVYYSGNNTTSNGTVTLYIVKALGNNRKIMTKCTINNCSTDYRRCLAVGDFNGDGKETIVFSGYYLDSMGNGINLTELSYSVEKNKISIIGSNFISVNTPLVRMGDVNNDGYDDLIVRGVHSHFYIYWGFKSTSIFGDYSKCTQVVCDSFHLKPVFDYGGFYDGVNMANESIDFVIADFDGKGDALWIVQQTRCAVIENGNLTFHGTRFEIYKAECNGYTVTVQPCVFRKDHSWDPENFLITIAAVNYDGDDQKPYLFLDGSLFKWEDGKFVYVIGDWYSEIRSYAIGNFTCDADGREQIVYTNSAVTRMLFRNGDKDGSALFNNNLNSLVAIDDDSDSEIVKFSDKFYAYSEPEVFGILQAAPYYSELNPEYQDVGWTQLTIEQSFTTSSTQTSGGEKQSGIGVHFKSLISSSNISYVSTKNISQSFKDEIQTSYSQTIEAGANDLVLLARTPYVYYVYNKWDNINSCYYENEVVMVVEQPTVYVALTVDEYNAFVKEYLKENPDYASKLKELDAVKNNIGYEGIPGSYTATEITATPFKNENNTSKYYQTDFSGSASTFIVSSAITKEQSSTTTKTQTVKLNGCYGYFGLIKEIGVTTEKAWSFINASTTSSAISSKISISGKVWSVNGAKMSKDGISSSIMNQYGFQWKLAHWDSDIPGIDYINGSSSITNVPIIGYIVKPSTTSNTLKTILPPKNVKAYIDYQYGSKEETGAISVYWDKYESTSYNIAPTKYKIYWGYIFESRYQYLGEVSGVDANRAFLSLPQSLGSWNGVCIVVQAVNGNSESIYSVKTMPIDGGTTRNTDFVVNYYKEPGDTTPYATQKYDYGAKLSFPAQPTMNPKPGQSITFNGWKNAKGTAYSATDIVTGNLDLYASFSYGDNVYQVNFYDKDGNIIKSCNLSHNETITAPTMSDTSDEKSNYTFNGWGDSADSQNIVQVPSSCTESKNYYAKYLSTTRWYNVCFTNSSGEPINSSYKKYKDTFQIIAGPQKLADDLYTYVFDHWAIKSGNANPIDQSKTTYECLGDVTFEPVFVENSKTHTVEFFDEEENLVLRKSYLTGQAINPPTMNPKYGDNYTYIFSHWTTNLDTKAKANISKCEGSATYYAVYDKEAKSYTITFLNADGGTISSSSVKYGEYITAPPSPTKEEDNLGTYVFSGWGAEVGKCYGTQTFTATFECIYKNYVVTFKDDGGNTVSQSYYHYGDTLNIPSMQSVRLQGQDEYYFSGWYKEGDATCTLVNVRNCYASATYVAIYTYQPHTYTVTFKDGEGNVLSTCSYLYGDTIAQPTVQQMAKADDEKYRYEFVGFDKDVYSTCVGDEEFTAQYEKINKQYIVMYQNYDESVLGTGWHTYSYGEALAVPMSTPTRADDANYSYRFVGWDNNHTGVCTGQCLYTAQYEAIPLQNTGSTTKTSLTSNQVFIILAVFVGVSFVALAILLTLVITQKGKVVININSKATSEDKNDGNK